MSQPTNDDSIKLTVHGRRSGPPTRRETMQWVLGAVAAASVPGMSRAIADEVPKKRGQNVPQEEAAKVPDPKQVNGYGTDPDVLKLYKPGDVWPLTFTPEQKQTATVLADLIIPKDDLGPAASEVGVVEMLDEWVSAPYPHQRNDRPVIIDGLAWIDAESNKRFGKRFAEISADQHRAICDDVCFTGTAKPEFRQGAEFFSRFRGLCASAYFATPQGWEAVGYVGNVALQTFDGPPPEVLERLGVTQTVA